MNLCKNLRYTCLLLGMLFSISNVNQAYGQTLLRKSDPGKYEGSAPVALNEWFTMRIEVNGESAEMFINDEKYSSFIVDKMLGHHKKGGVGLYVDIGTIGYFRDVKVTRRALRDNVKGEKVNDI